MVHQQSNKQYLALFNKKMRCFELLIYWIIRQGALFGNHGYCLSLPEGGIRLLEVQVL